MHVSGSVAQSVSQASASQLSLSARLRLMAERQLARFKLLDAARTEWWAIHHQPIGGVSAMPSGAPPKQGQVAGSGNDGQIAPAASRMHGVQIRIHGASMLWVMVGLGGRAHCRDQQCHQWWWRGAAAWCGLS